MFFTFSLDRKSNKKIKKKANAPQLSSGLRTTVLTTGNKHSLVFGLSLQLLLPFCNVISFNW
jgi:hypothetical protein